jgi:hypothetical protein
VKQAIESPAMVDYAQKNGFELYYGSEDDVRQELKRDREVTAALIEAMQKDKPAQ